MSKASCRARCKRWLGERSRALPVSIFRPAFLLPGFVLSFAIVQAPSQTGSILARVNVDLKTYVPCTLHDGERGLVGRWRRRFFRLHIFHHEGDLADRKQDHADPLAPDMEVHPDRV